MNIALTLRRMEIQACKPDPEWNRHLGVNIIETIKGATVVASGARYGAPRKVSWTISGQSITREKLHDAFGMIPEPRASAAQRAALENLYEGRELSDGINGQSAHGGLASTWASLQRNCWAYEEDGEHHLTEAGRLAIGKIDKNPPPVAPPAPPMPPGPGLTDSSLLDWAEANGASVLCSGKGQWQVTAPCDEGILFHGHGVTPREALANARRNHSGFAL